MDGKTGHVRVGLIGCGQIAQLAHLNIVRALLGVDLVAIAEADEERRDAAKRLAPGTRIVSDYRDLLALDGVDAVVISLPPRLHAESAAAAHESGRHVYLEKPLAIDRAGAETALEGWHASGKVGMMGFNYRFNRLFLEAKRLLVGQSLGKPVAVRTVFSSATRPRPEWMRRRDSGGGVLLDLGSHHVDLVRFLFGEVSEVACSLHGGASEDDTATLDLVLRDGPAVQSFFSHRAADEDRFEIYCEGGSLKIDRRHGLVAELTSGVDSAHRKEQLRHVWRSVRNAGYAMEKRRAFGHEPSWRHALEHFVEAAVGDHPASPDFEDGFRSLEVVLAAEEAARDGRRVRVEGATADRPTASDSPTPDAGDARDPRMSVIMVTRDRFDRLMHTLKRLREQTVAAQLEIVIVAPSRGEARVDESQLEPFHSFQLVETGPTTSSAAGRAAGVRAARSPVIAFTEDHSFPSPGWAAALIRAHERPWAAVGPAFLNGNPRSLLSWVNLLIEYGPWVWPVPAGPRGHIPPHNSSYKRDLLLAYGNRLEGMIEAETVLQWDLRARGNELYLEPEARTRHFNISRAGVSVPLRVAVGRMFGAARAREWSPAKRVAYVAASPLIPLVRFGRALRFVRGPTVEHGVFPAVLPALFVGFVLDGFGELMGYAFGGGDSVERVTRLEYDRERHMRPDERLDFAHGEAPA